MTGDMPVFLFANVMNTVSNHHIPCYGITVQMRTTFTMRNLRTGHRSHLLSRICIIFWASPVTTLRCHAIQLTPTRQQLFPEDLRHSQAPKTGAIQPGMPPRGEFDQQQPQQAMDQIHTQKKKNRVDDERYPDHADISIVLSACGRGRGFRECPIQKGHSAPGVCGRQNIFFRLSKGKVGGEAGKCITSYQHGCLSHTEGEGGESDPPGAPARRSCLR